MQSSVSASRDVYHSGSEDHGGQKLTEQLPNESSVLYASRSFIFYFLTSDIHVLLYNDVNKLSLVHNLITQTQLSVVSKNFFDWISGINFFQGSRQSIYWTCRK